MKNSTPQSTPRAQYTSQDDSHPLRPIASTNLHSEVRRLRDLPDAALRYRPSNDELKILRGYN